MNVEDALRTPSKGTNPASTASPSTTTRASAKKASKNAKITNFFPKVSSPLNRNSNSNQDMNENDVDLVCEISKDASSSSMKAPELGTGDINDKKKTGFGKDYVFIVPSSDDDTNVSTKGSTTSRRKKPPSLHSNNSKSSDGFVLTNTNNELGMEPRKKSTRLKASDKHDATSNQELLTTPSRSSGRDSKSRDSMPEKKFKSEPVNIQAFNQNSSGQRINRIQPIMIGNRTKTIDFQSVPSDLNLPRDQAMNLIERLFLVKMPEDFFLFWDFAKTINHKKPCSAFSHAHLDWKLVGPYDVLSGLITDFHGFSKEHLLRHCRYYYDPPEFQTVIVKADSNLTHYGYYRDEPDQTNPIVVMNRCSKGGQLTEVGDNLFTLLRKELDSAIDALMKSSQEIPQLTSSSSTTPRSGKSCEASKQSQLEKAREKQELTIMKDKLEEFCLSHENLSSNSWSRTSTRRSKRCAKTLNTVGIVVPMDGDVGYRDLGMMDTKLKSMITRISEFKDDDKTKCNLYKDLHQLINNVNMANDECDFGMGLELGLNLFFQGDKCFHKDIEFLLTNAYTLLGRNEFIEILKAHLEDRKKGDKVSLLD